MNVKTEERLPDERPLAKVCAMLFFAQIATQVFPAHANLAWTLSLLLGLIPFYFIPPQTPIKRLPFLVMGCLLAGAVRFLTPFVLGTIR